MSFLVFFDGIPNGPGYVGYHLNIYVGENPVGFWADSPGEHSPGARVCNHLGRLYAHSASLIEVGVGQSLKRDVIQIDDHKVLASAKTGIDLTVKIGPGRRDSYFHKHNFL
jgi:hypothetical protein